MKETDEILLETNHRTFDYPKKNWTYYQEWNDALFLHWKIPVEMIRSLIPQKLNVDTFDGFAYVSLVAFTMQKIRPKNLPALKFISDFHEINLRTYIENDQKKGVYFLNIEAEKYLSAFIAKKLSQLPYEKSNIKRTNKSYKSNNKAKNFYLDSEFEVKDKLTEKTNLDTWLAERYCLYLENYGKLYRYDIHHKEWELKNVELNQLNLKYNIGELNLTNKPDFAHYSEGVKVIAWKKTEI